MRYFIFLTSDGETKTSKGNDIENLQVLDWSAGKNKIDAFNNFIRENDYFFENGFDNVIVMELKNDKQKYLSIEDVKLVCAKRS